MKELGLPVWITWVLGQDRQVEIVLAKKRSCLSRRQQDSSYKNTRAKHIIYTGP